MKRSIFTSYRVVIQLPKRLSKEIINFVRKQKNQKSMWVPIHLGNLEHFIYSIALND